MCKPLVILLILSCTSVVTYTADQANEQHDQDRPDGPDGPDGLDGRSTCIKEESPSLTYAVDTTGSMYDDFMELKIVNKWLLERVDLKFPCGFRQYTMVEFNDPDVGPVRITNSMGEFGHFFDNLEAIGGGDCPEMSVTGIKLALQFSPDQSFIIVLTDASSLDYTNTTLVKEVYSLLSATESRVLILATGTCGSQITPDYTIYREISSRSFGHVFRLTLPDLNKAFHYLDYTLSMAVNSSKRLFSGDYTDSVHSEYFSVDDVFWSLMITTDGMINSFQLEGPGGSVLGLEELVSEHWGSMHLLKYPVKGNYTITINAGGVHAVRIQGFIDTVITPNCSLCHSNAVCDTYSGNVKCVCKDGFIGNGYNCIDIDECAYSWTHNCSVGTCQNTVGSYICLCPSGYIHLNGSCVPIRCDNPSLNKCHPLAICKDEVDGYSCHCPYGYYGDGFHCEIDECQRDYCGFGMDCTKSLGSYSCLDPCVSHTVLDEPWRGTDNILSSTKNCDISKNGWYQFVGNGGVRIPENCVDEGRCSTDSPVWMNGTHPVIKDGIVNRTACATWGKNCCQWTSTIQVKACSLGYHVYKLIGIPGSACTLSYCTDASTQTCKVDEEWQQRDTKYGCFCKAPYNITALSQVVPDLTCGLFEMNATFHKCQFNDVNIYFNDSHVKDKTCLTFQDNPMENTFSILSPLQVTKCGALTYEKNNSHVTYKTFINITVEQPGAIIIRKNTLNITLLCAYKLDMIASLNIALHPILSSITITVWGTGQFEVIMALYQDSGYTTPYTGTSVTLSTDDYLYVGVFVNGGTSNFVLVMKNCYATPRNDIKDSVKYDLIQDSCANLQDGTVTVIKNGESREGQFSVQMFKFVGNYEEVYLHCAVSLCDSSTGDCKPDCPKSKSRSDGTRTATSFDGTLSIGPIRRSGGQILTTPKSGSSTITGAHIFWTLLIPALIILTHSL